MANGVTLNDEQRLYVIPSGSGYSALGYDVCFEQTKELARRTSRPELEPDPSERGTLELYDRYRTLLALYSKIGDGATWFNNTVDHEIRTVLERARASGERIKIWYGDTHSGQAWADKPETGRVGRSMGPMKVPILLSRSNSTGGEAILTGSIVRIEDRAGKSLYSHPDFEAFSPDQEDRPGPRF